MYLMLGDTNECLKCTKMMQLEKRKAHTILLQVAQSVLFHELYTITGDASGDDVRETLSMLNDLRDVKTGRWPVRWEHMLAILYFCYYREPPFNHAEIDKLIERMRHRNSFGHLAQLQLLMAEHARVTGRREESVLRATEASYLLIKGRSPLMVYRPALVARCAVLLDGNDDALAKRARKNGVGWILDSANRLQDSERTRFINAHPIHAELLDRCGVSCADIGQDWGAAGGHECPGNR